ncbi:MAG: histidine phosphatase family protein [Phreatobacter sp.]|uniref:histidine phosphatase family protein n=1 Tax=Phreatobacter sp. TaxID=1966341 RepID=UPI004036C326
MTQALSLAIGLRFRTLARAALLLAAAGLLTPSSPALAQDAGRAWEVLAAGGVVLFRHANAPGGGDPPGMRIGDCGSQRNLDAAGRDQARRIGAAFAGRGIAVGAVLTSQWCRTRETAALAFPGRGEDAPAFNSFFGDRATGPAQTEAARAVLGRWSGPGALVVVTHQVNITALTGIFPASGEGIVLERDGSGWRVAGRIRP